MAQVRGMISDQAASGRQRNNQNHAQKQQFEYQTRLNQQNQELALNMWDKTNHEAQRKHMENAGLNAGLMYGMNGGGGATTSGGQGGSIGMATAPVVNQGTNAGIAQMAQLALLTAQKENIEADTENKKAEIPVKGADVTLKGTQAENIKSDTTKSNM